MARIGPRIELQLRALVVSLGAALALIIVTAVAPGPVVALSQPLEPDAVPLIVRSGTRVTWEHHGTEPLQLNVSPAGGGSTARQIQTRSISPGERWAYRFTVPGEYVMTVEALDGRQWRCTITVRPWPR